MTRTDLTDSVRASHEQALAFARALPDDDLLVREHDGQFSRALWNACAAFGVQGLMFPRDVGGRGLDVLHSIATHEALGQGCRDNGVLFGLAAQLWSVQLPLQQCGTPEQRARYLSALCRGTWVGAHAMTEPDTGSDAFALQTRATRDGDDYLLDGAKAFVSLAPVADVFVVFATIDPTAGPLGITAFLVERTAPGLQIGPAMPTLGLRTAPIGSLTLDRCRVPRTAVLGREGRGAEIFRDAMAWERSAILASGVGTMQRLLDDAVAMVRARGRDARLNDRLVDMRVRVEQSRLMLYRAVRARQHARETDAWAAMAKMSISTAFVDVASDAIAVCAACDRDTTEAERVLRDAMGSRLYSGSDAMQRRTIARDMRLPTP